MIVSAWKKQSRAIIGQPCEREPALMRFILNNTIMASHSEVDSIAGVEKLHDFSQDWKEAS